MMSLRRLVTSRFALVIANPLVLVLVAALLIALPASRSSAAAVEPDPAGEASAPVVTIEPEPATRPQMPPLHREPVMWPVAGIAAIELPISESGARLAGSASVGGLPVRIAPVSPAGDVLSGRFPAGAGRSGPARVSVEVVEGSAVGELGYPLAIRLARADGAAHPTTVRVTVDYSAFRDAFGGDWDSRLRLTELAPCAFTTPTTTACQWRTDLPTTNDIGSRLLTADVEVGVAGRAQRASDAPDSGMTVIALMSGPSSDVGDFTKTSFKSSSSWQAGQAGGEFTWSYPMAVPPTPGGLEPDVGWHYSSSLVDGQTVGQNVQPFWGEGWESNQGYIERSYRVCKNDTANSPVYPNATADLCWRLPNARMVLGGQSVEFVRDDATGAWRAADDNAAKIELLTTGTVTGYFNNEYWKVTTVDGIQYYFGLTRLPGWQTGDRETGSVNGAPVFANHAGEPCFNGGGFTVSWCAMAYRWNLDYVVDRHGNTMSFWYSRENNQTGLAANAWATSWYVRFSVLDRIEYGTRAGTGATRESRPDATPPARVLYTTVDRCWSGSCPVHDGTYPDTPWDLDCQAAPCTGNLSPSFWSSRRISQVATEVWSGSGSTYNRVDEWALGADFPGDASGNPLWITSITRTGKVGGTLAMPPVLFYGTTMQNRADYDPNGTMADPHKYRITRIDNESGGQLLVTYSAEESGCQFGSPFPDPDQNSRRCFPRYWTNPSGSSGWAWWHKYVVTDVVERDLVGATPDVEYHYTYTTDGGSNPVMWAHDDGAMVFTTPGAYKSYADWRGYATVVETVGPATGQQSQTRTLYFRGLAEDMTDAGEFTRLSTVTNSLGEVSQDYRQYAGIAHEVQTLDGPGGQVIAKDITDPTRAALTATETHTDVWTFPTRFYSYITRTAKERSYTWLPASGSWLAGRSDYTWNTTYGVAATVDDQGNIATNTDDVCTRYSYTFPGSGQYLIDFPNRIESVGVNCATTAAYPADAVSDVRFYHDNAAAYTGAPVTGNVTKIDAVGSFTGATPNPVKQATYVYDTFGRTTSAKNALDHETLFTYTQSAAGLLSNLKERNPLAHEETDTFDTGRGTVLTSTDANGKSTTASYDPLGRMLKLWRPGHPTSGTPDIEYQYGLHQTPASYTRSRVFGPNGNQIDSYEILDGHLRPRQTQVTSPSGKRTITDTIYDTRGLPVKASMFHNADIAPTSTLVTAADTSIATQARYTYDGAGRQLTDQLWSNNVFKWQSTIVHGGDRTAVVPPTGGTVTENVVDVFGQTIQTKQYPGPGLTGTPIVTGYTYDDAGQLTRQTDHAGNQWNYTYDLLGRRTQAIDPDAGTSSWTYDNAARTLTATDGRNQTLAYNYDNLGRRTETRVTTSTGTLRAAWTYDPTGAKGQLSTATRHDSGLAYVTTISGYNNFYQPTGVSVTVPASTANGALAGSYTTGYTYKTNGAPATTTLPAAGGLTAETLTHAYTNQGFPSTVTSPLATYVGSTTYAFDGLITQRLLGASGKRVKLAAAIDAATRRLTQQTTQTETATVGTYTSPYSTDYSYDQAGNVTAAAGKTNIGSGLVADQKECFQYDYLRRLSTAWTQTSGTCSTPQRTGADPYWRQFTFDNIGNRLTQTDKDAGAGDTTWTYIVGSAGSVRPHQLKQINATGPNAGTPTRTYGYDNAGNTTTATRTTGAAQTLTWDIEGNLVSITEGSQTTNFLYDADGERLIRRDPDGSAILYLPGQEMRKSPTDVIAATRYYGSIASRTSSGLTWLSSDHHGTAQISIDPVTLATTRRRNLPYGGARGSQPAWPNDKGFIGGTTDPTGLTHLGARQYDPTTGRFASVDPVIDLAEPQQWHGYAYADNNPATFTDPTGLVTMRDTSGGGGGVYRFPIGRPAMAAKPAAPPPPKISCGRACNGGLPKMTPPRANPGGSISASELRLMKTTPKVQTTRPQATSPKATPPKTTPRPTNTPPAPRSAPSPQSPHSPTNVPTSPKQAPNPDGKKGGPAHQQKTESVKEQLEVQGYRVKPEVMFRTDGGYKPNRYADLVAYDKAGNIVSVHQIGRQTKGGLPVMRETLAASDIWSVLPPGVRVFFQPYK